MKLWRSMMALPQPVKGCLLFYLIAFGVAFVSIPAMAFAGQGQANAVVPWTMGVEDWEFQSRLGCTVDEAKALHVQLCRLLDLPPPGQYS